MTRALRSTTLVLGAAIAIGIGCFGRRLPPMELYRLAPTVGAPLPTEIGASRGQLAPGAIAIAPYQTPGIYGGRGIVFRIDDTKYGVYPSREWALPVGTMLGLITEDVFRRAPVTQEPALFDPPSYRTQHFVWRALVREMEEVNRGRGVYAAVRLEARVVRSSDDSVVWSGSAGAERAVPQGTMPAIVSTLSALSVEVIGRLAGEARASLARSAASAARD